MRPLWQKATWLGIASYLRRQHFCDATWALTREGIMGTRFCNATWALTREGKMGTRFCNATWALTREGKMGTVYQGWQCLPSTESPRAERYLFEIGYLRIRVRDGTSRPAWDGLSGVAVHANSTKTPCPKAERHLAGIGFPKQHGCGHWQAKARLGPSDASCSAMHYKPRGTTVIWLGMAFCRAVMSDSNPRRDW